MSEYSKFGLGPISDRLDAAGYGWKHMTDQGHNACVWILSPCSEGYLMGTPREKWKFAHRRQRLEAKKMWRDFLQRGQIGTTYGVTVVRSSNL